MSVGVVDPLEVVDVDHQQRHRPAVAVGAGELRLESLVEGRAVERASQAVMGGALFELPVELVEGRGSLVDCGRELPELVEAVTKPDPVGEILLAELAGGDAELLDGL